MQDRNSSRTLKAPARDLPGQVVLVLQGGGALGSYQAGVYQALHEVGIEPDWIIGTSIGAINASLIAGNEPEHRLDRLREFWKRMEQKPAWNFRSLSGLQREALLLVDRHSRVAGFFRPNPLAHAGDTYALGPERAGYYTTSPLQATLEELVDFDLVNRCTPRLTVGAAHVRTSQMRYFDSRDGAISVKHVMASGALPPAFPAVRIEGELYWDGGILSNTPTEAVFDDNPRQNSLIFSVHLWNPTGTEPTTMAEVLNSHKDVQYSSRIMSHIERQQQSIGCATSSTSSPRDCRIANAAAQRYANWPGMAARRACTSFACWRRSFSAKTHTKDIDFSPRRDHAAVGCGICAHPLCSGTCPVERRV